MTIVKNNGEEHMEDIVRAEIQEIDENRSVDCENEDIEAELDDVVGEIEAEVEKPQITLKFRKANFVHLWDLNATNQNCLCEKDVTSPTERDLQNRRVYSNYTVSRCGCAYHSSCISEYVKQAMGGNPNMANCPLCQTKYEPITSTQNEGVYVAA